MQLRLLFNVLLRSINRHTATWRKREAFMLYWLQRTRLMTHFCCSWLESVLFLEPLTITVVLRRSHIWQFCNKKNQISLLRPITTRVFVDVGRFWCESRTQNASDMESWFWSAALLFYVSRWCENGFYRCDHQLKSYMHTTIIFMMTGVNSFLKVVRKSLKFHVQLIDWNYLSRRACSWD